MLRINEKILSARETRFKKIDFLKNHFKTVVTIKSNIPGNNKNHYISYLLVDVFKKAVNNKWNCKSIFYDGYDGPYYLLGTNTNPIDVKKELILLEDTHELGRFIDLDVFDGVTTLSRNEFRKCYLCNKQAIVCMREKNHTLKELINFMEKSVLEYFKNHVANLIKLSINLELDLDPKFGLVTPKTNGSHLDMNYNLMKSSINTILPFFQKMFIIGWSKKKLNEIFEKIRIIGIEAEKEMYNITNNINTYKGLIFDLGIVITAYSYCLYNHINLLNIFEVVKRMTINILEDFKIPTNTFGYYAYSKYKITGARGEVHNGLKTVKEALEYLIDFSQQSKLRTLMFIISKSEDTVLLKRSKSFIKYDEYRTLFRKNIFSTNDKIEDLNQYCISNNLSFGGSADLLILTFFIKMIVS